MLYQLSYPGTFRFPVNYISCNYSILKVFNCRACHKKLVDGGGFEPP